ncbi:MAG: Fe-S cluster assembly ATPase SufC [Acidobacteria bacterium]|nr:Fe-S cluster assembly ATPase SufC [Acidobacteriota bacterium]
MSTAQRTPVFSCEDLHVYVDEKEIVKGVSLEIYSGEKHALMGPNGSGKSTLAAALMGHPAYRVEGNILLGGEPIGDLPANERARRGMFLGFQYPVAVPGVSVASFLRAALSARRGKDVPVREFRALMDDAFKVLNMPRSFMARYLNDGFSGGEKKRLEILQMMILKPLFALLDETDSGLDIDALKVVSEGINRAAGSETGVLLVTHYQRILNYIAPDAVHVFMDGRVVRSGGPELALELEERGYDWLEPEAARAAGGAR